MRPSSTHLRTSSSTTTRWPGVGAGRGRPLRTTVMCVSVTRGRKCGPSACGGGVAFDFDAAEGRLDVRLAEEILERRKWLDHKEHLVRERTASQRDQPVVPLRRRDVAQRERAREPPQKRRQPASTVAVGQAACHLRPAQPCRRRRPQREPKPVGRGRSFGRQASTPRVFPRTRYQCQERRTPAGEVPLELPCRQWPSERYLT